MKKNDYTLPSRRSWDTKKGMCILNCSSNGQGIEYTLQDYSSKGPLGHQSIYDYYEFMIVNHYHIVKWICLKLLVEGINMGML